VLDIGEHRLMVSENRVLKKIFGANRDEVTRDWGRFHNEELHYLQAYSSKFYSDDQIKKHKMDGACGMYGGEKKYIHDLGWET